MDPREVLTAQAEIVAALRALDLCGADEAPAVAALSGGVSCEVFRVDLASGPVCAKRALPKLRVKADWRAPVERADYEAEWLRRAGAIAGVCVPRVLAHDPARHLIVMNWFEPTEHPVWKAELLAGHVDPAFAAAVGRAFGRVHAATADDPQVAAAFPTDPLFEALRLEPFLRFAGVAHPDVAARLNALADRTKAMKRALVHGDASPKNILVGAGGPVLLDAECAWWGDPAFDLAFLVHHLLVKAVRAPGDAPRLLAAARALADAHLAEVAWEPRAELEARAAALVPALMLARVDGRSPVDYLDETQRGAVRAFARPRVAAPAPALSPLFADLAEALP